MASAYLDASVLIPIVQGAPEERASQRTQLAERIGRATQWVASDLVRMECKVRPLARGDDALVGDIDSFFASPRIECLSFVPATFDRAAAIRARFGYRTPDALHLAAAGEAGCDFFVTSDRQLAAFTDIPVVLLNP
jgi:predicted nucleic acid-binding protein